MMAIPQILTASKIELNILGKMRMKRRNSAHRHAGNHLIADHNDPLRRDLSPSKSMERDLISVYLGFASPSL